jgi:hypothetical protein
MEGIFDPLFQGFGNPVSMKYDKANMFVSNMQMVGVIKGINVSINVNYSYDILGSFYPLQVGKEWKITETETTDTTISGKTTSDTKISTYSYKVVGIEDVTVPAGVFRSFKIVKNDDKGVPTSNIWQSDKVKTYNVKEVDLKRGEIVQLISYSFP